MSQQDAMRVGPLVVRDPAIRVNAAAEPPAADRRHHKSKLHPEPQQPHEALRALFETSTDALFVLRLDATEQPCLEEFNPVFARLFGIKTSTHGDKPLELLPPAIVTSFASAALRCRRSCAPTRLHLSLDTDEGTTECDFLFTPVTGRRGSVEQIAGQGRVQPSVQAPQGDRGALRDGIARTTRDLLYVFDRSVKPSLFLNERVHDVLGDGVDEIRRMTPETLKARIHPDDLPRVLAHYRKLADLPPGAVISIELRVRHADGHYVFLASKDTVLKSDGDQATKIVGCATDVSDHRHALGEVKKISKQLLRTQNEERRRIGRELHDSTAQHLVAVGIGLARLDMIHQQEPDARMGRAEVREVLVDARKSINEAQREMRALSYLLHPPTLERLGLSHTLRRFAAGFARRTKIRVDQAIQDDVVCRSREVATALLRVAQEALINVYHHADATSVAIRLAAADGRLTLEVEDDGKGLGRPNMTDLEDVDTLGVGIPGMRARVRQFHGELEIQSRENGVLVRATIPERARGLD